MVNDPATSYAAAQKNFGAASAKVPPEVDSAAQLCDYGVGFLTGATKEVVMTTFKKVLGAAVSAMLVSAPVAATAAQPVRPSASLVSSQSQGVKSGIRTSSVKKGENSALGGAGLIFFIIGGAAFIYGLSEVLGDDDNSPR
jgi:hypothetical protein